jgi:molecular chaperone HtpG
MARIEFPKQLKKLLDDSDFQAPLRALADRVGEILTDNKLPFFPDYTDHGVGHIRDVLKAEVELVPKSVWEQCGEDADPKLLTDADAAVIIGATLLHDIGMHVTVPGFQQLVAADTRFKPLPWFDQKQEGHRADRPWPDLWADYQREARRLSERDLTNIVGETSARVWKFDGLPTDAGQWQRNHYLVIGEFLRRHHARLAHEVAIYGFPGLPIGAGEGQFPAMGSEQGHPLRRLADLIGLTARSHGMSLRAAKAYLDAQPEYRPTPQPMNSAVLYPMALLRVADYLQIDRGRAPAALLQLREPQSPLSVIEWQKHHAVQQITPASDPRGKMVTVDAKVPLPLYLQLRDLLAGLQEEMDLSTAVLDEAYGTLTHLGLHQLMLATRRVYSNLHSPAFLESLPYVPSRTGFTSDPNLLTLLVEPLYGREPGVGVRELIQNAADAVCELEAWCKSHGKEPDNLERPSQDVDVLVDFIQRADGTWFLRVTDRGIGMQADTIQNYFLRAGASFRRSVEWAKEFADESGAPKIPRAGRFGIGAFAVFLLGPSFRMWTRHASNPGSMGCSVEAAAHAQLIQISRADGLAVGTTIEVELSAASVGQLELEIEDFGRRRGPQRFVDWFVWDWPDVQIRVSRDAMTHVFPQDVEQPIRRAAGDGRWAAIHPDGFDVVYWSHQTYGSLSCNGLAVHPPGQGGLYDRSKYRWPEEMPFQAPALAVIDSAANLPLTTQRYGLVDNRLPFETALTRDVWLSFIAHALVDGPTSRSALLSSSAHPLTRGRWLDLDSSRRRSFVSWCASDKVFLPVDSWLIDCVEGDTIVVLGIAVADRISRHETWGMDTAWARKWSRADAVLRGEGMSSVLLMDLRLTGSGLANYMHDLAENIQALADGYVPGIADVLRTVALVVDVDEHADAWFKRPSKSGTAEWTPAGSRGNRYKRKRGSFRRSDEVSRVDLLQVLGTLETGAFAWDTSDNTFAAELRRDPVQDEPTSLLAKLWIECLGRTGIPFDAVDRQALIAKARQHPELKRHMDAWQAAVDAGRSRP